MKSKPVAFLMADQFRTMKYRPEFPDRFGCIQDSRAFCQQFFQWYNEEHRHFGIALLAPAMVHFGEAQTVLAHRQVVLDATYQQVSSFPCPVSQPKNEPKFIFESARLQQQ